MLDNWLFLPVCADVCASAEGGLPLSISSQLIAVLSRTPALEKGERLCFCLPKVQLLWALSRAHLSQRAGSRRLFCEAEFPSCVQSRLSAGRMFALAAAVLHPCVISFQAIMTFCFFLFCFVPPPSTKRQGWKKKNCRCWVYKNVLRQGSRFSLFSLLVILTWANGVWKSII